MYRKIQCPPTLSSVTFDQMEKNTSFLHTIWRDDIQKSAMQLYQIKNREEKMEEEGGRGAEFAPMLNRVKVCIFKDLALIRHVTLGTHRFYLIINCFSGQ